MAGIPRLIPPSAGSGHGGPGSAGAGRDGPSLIRGPVQPLKVVVQPNQSAEAKSNIDRLFTKNVKSSF